MGEVDENRALLNEAKELEKRRIEITAEAIEKQVADLLPYTWSMMAAWGRELLVHVSFNTGLEGIDADRMTERDCRNFIRFVGELADQRRAYLDYEKRQEEEDSEE